MKHGNKALVLCLASFIYSVWHGKPVDLSMAHALCAALFYWAFCWVCDRWHEAGGGIDL